MKKGYDFKSLYSGNGKLQSNHDYSVWKSNEWRRVEGEVRPCFNGFHSFRPDGIQTWVDWGDTLTIVQVRGDRVKHSVDYNSQSTKYANREMRVVKVLPVTGRFLTKFARDNQINSPHITLEDVETTSTPLSFVWYLLESSPIRLGRKLADAILAEYAPEYL